MKAFSHIKSRAIIIPEADIDTDQMVPARFLRTASAEGLGACLFYDRRREAQHANFPLNPPHYHGESILLTGPNFGCGSSREHAPWALLDFGFRVLIGTSFADIFYSNCLKNGLLPIVLEAAEHAQLSVPGLILEVNLEDQSVKADSLRFAFSIDPFARFCLLHGLDELDYILRQAPEVARFEADQLPRLATTTALLTRAHPTLGSAHFTFMERQLV